MKITVAKKDLEDALKIVSSSIASNGTDISAHYLFRARGEGDDLKVEILTTSNRLYSSAPLVCACDGEGSFTIEGKRLKQWLSAVSDSALDFEYVDKEVTARAPRGSAVFQSLDPSLYPFWDTLLEESELKAKLPASRLHKALAYVKHFISTDESNSPNLCVTEVCSGSLISTNKITACMVTVKGLEEASFRVHGKDIPAILTFLAKSGEEEVEILEHPRAVLFRAADGSIFFEAKFRSTLPTMHLDTLTEPDQWWELPVQELKSGISFVSATAPRDDTHLCLDQAGSDGIHLWMASSFLSKKKPKLKVDCLEQGTKESSAGLPEEGFKVSYPQLQKVLSGHEDTKIRLCLHIVGTRGALWCDEERGGDAYRSVLTFLRR